jgi:hypothetical protein
MSLLASMISAQTHEALSAAGATVPVSWTDAGGRTTQFDAITKTQTVDAGEGVTMTYVTVRVPVYAAGQR